MNAIMARVGAAVAGRTMVRGGRALGRREPLGDPMLHRHAPSRGAAGGDGVIRRALELDLVDELSIVTAPVILGGGKGRLRRCCGRPTLVANARKSWAESGAAGLMRASARPGTKGCAAAVSVYVCLVAPRPRCGALWPWCSPSWPLTTRREPSPVPSPHAAILDWFFDEAWEAWQWSIPSGLRGRSRTRCPVGHGAATNPVSVRVRQSRRAGPPYGVNRTLNGGEVQQAAGEVQDKPQRQRDDALTCQRPPVHAFRLRGLTVILVSLFQSATRHVVRRPDMPPKVKAPKPCPRRVRVARARGERHDVR